MEERKISNALSNVLTFYYESIKLKEVERSGWVDRNISRDQRVESVPEHVYSCLLYTSILVILITGISIVILGMILIMIILNLI